MSEALLKFASQTVRVCVEDGWVVRVDLLPLGREPGFKPGPVRDPILKKALSEIRDYLAGRRRRFTVPFRQSGTPFQQAVWKALSRVPYGRVLSYGELAALVGRPRAARAVGSAMRRNQLPLLVPCHRVVAGRGLGGFGCGLEWKKKLLELEKVKDFSKRQVPGAWS
jgi:methylated-DNA-[protein]-cysteine S-methyltransferase